MKDIAIQIKNLTKAYKMYDKPSDRLKESLSIRKKQYHTKHYALKNISFDIKKGDILGIIGTNGSGKSTLLKIITGVLTQTEGEVKVNGSISALLELGTGFNPEYTGIQNIYLNGTMLNKTKEEIDEQLDEIINFADIGEFINQPVKTYSSGMFARLAFAVAINVKPDILIVDEILSVGDLRFQIKCMNKMKEMMLNGTTVLFVNHDINAIKRFCNKAIWINKGEIVDYNDVDIVTDKYLDFLKVDSKTQEIKEKKSIEKNKEEIPFKDKNDCIAEIKSFTILDENHREVSEVKPNIKTSIEVIYDVYEEDIKNPVIGISMHSIDDKYICGINTLLDKVKIPWKKGRNRICLEYSFGVLALGGKYYFDTAIFEETATVPIQYIAKIKEFTIVSKYIGEGMYIPPHKWEMN